MIQTLDPLADWLSNNLRVTAPVVAFIVSVALYGVLGRDSLGANDDYWPRIRRVLLPLLDKLGATSGLYAMRVVSEDEFVATVSDRSLDQLERDLYNHGFERNPLAGLKMLPNGTKSSGSWARRYSRIRILGDRLRALDVPIAGPVGTVIGRVLQASGEILARRQLHVTLFETSGGEIDVYAHDEPNSLNPLTAWQHYLGIGQSVRRGVRKTKKVLRKIGVEIET